MKKLLTIFIFTTFFLAAFALAENVLATDKACTSDVTKWTGVCKADCTGFACGQTSYLDCDASLLCCIGDITKDKCDTVGGTCKPKCGTGETKKGCCSYVNDTDSKFCCVSSTATTPTPTPAKTPATGGTTTPSNVRIPTAGTSQASEAVELSRLKALGFSGTIPGLIGNIVKSILSFVGAFALLMVVYGGLLLLISQGNPEGVGKGKKIITWAIIGVAVILGSYVLVDFVIKGIGGGGGGGTGPGGATSTQGDIPNCVTDLGGTCKPACATGEENLNPTSDCKQICCYLPSPAPMAPVSQTKDTHGCTLPNNVLGCTPGPTISDPTKWSCCDCGLPGSGTEGKNCQNTSTGSVPLHCGTGSRYCK